MDFTEQRFGRLVAKYKIVKNKRAYWHCVCDCGNEKDVYYYSLVAGKIVSCGCYHKEARIRNNNKIKRNVNNSANIQDKLNSYIGKIYGEMEVVSAYKQQKNRVYLELKCKNNHSVIRRNDFVKNIKKCPVCEKIKVQRSIVEGKSVKEYEVLRFSEYRNNVCYFLCSYENTMFEKSYDEISEDMKWKPHEVRLGDRFGSLEVKDVYIKDNRTYCKCLCDCGNEIEVYKGYIYSRRSCGCNIYKLRESFIGKKFGRWKVLALNKETGKLLCRCECGTEREISTSDLNSNHSQSCGCLTREIASQRMRKNLIGQTFGKIEIIDRIENENKTVGKYVCRCECGTEFLSDGYSVSSGIIASCGCCTNGTKEETEIKEYIEKITGKTFRKCRILDGKEMDIYNDELKIGLEFNGSVYHATINNVFEDKDKLYHRNKFLCAKQKGIRLITIFDVDWWKNKEKIKEYLKYILTKQTRIYSRNTEIKEIEKDTAREFIEQYHLQGFYNMCSINYGLFYNYELVSVMSFGQLRMKTKKENHYELHRFCVKNGYTVVGGASKLFSHFVSEYNPEYILSYSDNDYFNGDMYKILGFIETAQTDPRYYWFYRNNEVKREKCQLKNLEKDYPELYKLAIETNAKNKETYIMSELGARKVYRCGNTRWEWYKQK